MKWAKLGGGPFLGAFIGVTATMPLLRKVLCFGHGSLGKDSSSLKHDIIKELERDCFSKKPLNHLLTNADIEELACALRSTASAACFQDHATFRQASTGERIIVNL